MLKEGNRTKTREFVVNGIWKIIDTVAVRHFIMYFTIFS